MFASDSIWAWEAERNFAKLKTENPDLVQSSGPKPGVVDVEHAVAPKE